MIVRKAAQALLALSLLGSAACGSQEAETQVVVGLTTDIAVGFDIDRIEITASVDGAVRHTEGRSYDAGELSLPAELLVTPTRDGAEVSVSVAAFRDGDPAPRVIRRATTRAVGGRKELLPLSLDEACLGRSCAASETCVKGACVDPFLAPGSLADYDPSWIVSAPDACKTSTSGEARVVIGKGQEAFATLETDELMALEPGPQGGHHVWIALRVAGLRQMGSRLTVGGTFPELAFKLPPARSSVTLRKAADDQCEIHGVRFQVDRGIAVDSIRGHRLDMEITLEDPTGDEASAVKRVVLPP